MTFRYLRNEEVTPEITAKSREILAAYRHQPWGTSIPFEANGRQFIARIERHFHPIGGAIRPWGEHTGCSVGVEEDTIPPTVPDRKFHLSALSLKRLDGVDTRLVSVVKAAIEITEIDFTVVEGLRSMARQRELFQNHASETMNSRHLTGHAVDLAPWVHNQISWAWGDFNKLAPFILKAAQQLDVPIEWGGNWKPPHMKDGPHWQIPWGK
jgi:peptidoglycan L-alanyl-D-glutamate endopeptidase CwlK